MESTDSREFHPTFRNSGVQTMAARPHFSGIVGFQALNFNFMFLWIIMGCFTLELDQAPQH